MGEIQTPALVIGGAEDPATPPSDAQWLHRQIAGSRIAILSGVGHVSTVERPDAFNEVLRYDMPTQFLGRTAVRDTEIGGRTIKKDQPVIFLYASANRDEREFPNPDVFDIKRRAPRFLSFGAGHHACLGTHVARMEGKVCLEEMLSRFPEYEVDLDNAKRFRTEFVQGFQTLPVRIG